MNFARQGTKEKKKHFVALFLRNGELSLVVRGRKKIETAIERKLNDGQWHRVVLSGNNKVLNIQVLIGMDAKSSIGDSVKTPRRISATNMLLVGGVSESTVSLPAELASRLEHRFRGCIRRFRVNNATQDLARPGRHVSIGQCFPQVEKGSHFPGDAFAVYSNPFSPFSAPNIHARVIQFCCRILQSAFSTSASCSSSNSSSGHRS